MAKNRGVTAGDEIDVAKIRRNSKPPYLRFLDWISEPANSIWVLVGLLAVGFVVPALVFFAFAAMGILKLITLGAFTSMPIRVPLAAKMIDRSEPIPNSRKFDNGKGIMYLGHDRLPGSKGEQAWASDSDSRTHFFALGTTGSGKTQALLSWAFNALSWGSSFVYIDGKADNELIFQAYAMHKRLNREDDLFVVNFMTGDSDAFEIARSNKKWSNTLNPMARASSNSLTQLVSSLMSEAGGDNAMWQGLAIGMVNAVIIGLCYKRFRDGFTIDAGILRDHIELGQLISLTKEFERRADVPKDLVFKPLKTYLLNLPGFDWEMNLMREQPVSEDTKKQHDFRSMQFLRQLTMLADTYGSIFKAQIPEVDMLDTVLKRRSVIVCIPSLEKSEEESTGVGKLVVSAIRLMMSKTLGSDVEGDYDSVVNSKPTKAPYPFMAIFDELGYYFTKGMAIMFAQARGLGFALFAAGQDLSAMMKGQNKEEAESVIANTKFKITLALEDAQHTGDLIIKTGGEAMISEVAGYEGKMGSIASATYRDNLNATIQMRKRLTLEELRDMDSGQSVLMWRDRIFRMQNFYIFDGPGKIGRMKSQRLNRLLSCFPPGISEMKDYIKPAEKKKEVPYLQVLWNLVSPSPIVYAGVDTDDVADELLYDPSTEVDILRNKGGVNLDLGLFYKHREWFLSQNRGTEKSTKKTARGLGLSPVGHRDDSNSVASPVISEASLQLDFDTLFRKGDELVYPIRPVINETNLQLGESVAGAGPVISESSLTISMTDSVSKNLEILDKILGSENESRGSISKILQYRSTSDGLKKPQRDLHVELGKA